jgi:hypothetical protein
MAELGFDALLDRMFADVPVFADADTFARRIDERLDRGWTVRRTVIGGLGLIGGLIGGAQILGSGLLSRMGELTNRSDRVISAGLSDLVPTDLMPRGILLNGEILWMAAALAAVAVGFALTRALREF